MALAVQRYSFFVASVAFSPSSKRAAGSVCFSMSSPTRKNDVVPGPGAYNPKEIQSSRSVYIPPLPPVPEVPDSQDKEALTHFEKRQQFMQALAESKHRMPELGSYSLPGAFDKVVGRKASPRSPRHAEQLFGTPRSERVLFNVDLFETSKRPGPGQYSSGLQANGVGGRDRLYRKRLALESVNYMAPQLPPISPRRM